MRRYRATALAAIGILVLAACSSSTADVDPTTTIASPVTTSPVTTSPVTTSPPAPSATTEAPPEPSHIVVTSSAYAEGDRIPVVHSCDGEDTSPDYALEDLPTETVSVVLTMDDPDAPGGTWDHWVVFDMAPVTEIPIEAAGLGTMGSNSWGTLGYGGPCPPPGNAHRYVVSVYALDGRLALDEGATKADVLAAMGGHILATGELTGEFSR